ncbi:Subtilisin-like protease SBT3.11, partial [Mucuna pruriens]
MGTPFLKLAILAFFAFVCIAMSDSAAKPLDQHATASSPAVHIVYTERPQDEEPEAYHIRTLSAVFGSEEAAKEALLYSYKSAASGFSAKLTPEQVEQSNQVFFKSFQAGHINSIQEEIPGFRGCSSKDVLVPNCYLHHV